MAHSKRERYIVILTVAAVVVLGLDRLVLSPVLGEYAKMDTRRKTLLGDQARARSVSAQRRPAAAKWHEMVTSGLKSDPAEAESQVRHAIYDWATEAGLTLQLVKSERLTEKTLLPEIVFQAAGTGTMSAITRLLWHVQTASIPVKVTDVQISSRKEGTDDLSVQFHISTIYTPAEAAAAADAASAPADTAGGK